MCCLFVEMNRFSLDNNNFPYDNNVLVLDMVLGSLWGAPQTINWDNVAKLVPGFTAKEVPTVAVLHQYSLAQQRSVWFSCCSVPIASRSWSSQGFFLIWTTSVTPWRKGTHPLLRTRVWTRKTWSRQEAAAAEKLQVSKSVIRLKGPYVRFNLCLPVLQALTLVPLNP